MNRQIKTMMSYIGDTIEPLYSISGDANYSFMVVGNSGSYDVTPVDNGQTIYDKTFVPSGAIASLPDGNTFVSSRLVLRRYTSGFGDELTYNIRIPLSDAEYISYTIGSNISQFDGYVDWYADTSDTLTPGMVIPEIKPSKTSDVYGRLSAMLREPDGGYHGGYAFVLLFVELTYEASETPCIAPASVKLTKEYCKADQTVNLRWSGADEGRGHPIIGYEIQYSDDGGTTWNEYATASTTETYGTIAVRPPDDASVIRQFRLRTVCGHEQYSSDWLVCPQTLTLLIVAGDSETPRLPWLLDRDLNRICRLYPLSGSLTLNLTPPSSAELSLMDDVDITPRQFVEMYDNNGSAGVYQVSAISHDYQSGTLSVSLEHAIVTLGDALLLTEGTLSGTVSDVITQLLSYQTAVKSDGSAYWQMGESETPDTMTISVTYSSGNLMTVLNTIITQLSSGYMLDLEQINGVWKINVLSYPADVSVVRMTRNMMSISTSVDATELITRLYPYGSGNGTERVDITQVNDGVSYIDADSVSTYGIIAATLTAETIDDPATLLDYARRYLDAHSQPTASIEVSALDLSAATGETVDGFDLGWTCNVSLPQYGTVYNEHITSINYSDLYGAPNSVALTLSNREQDVADSIVSLQNAVAIRQFGAVETAAVSYEFGYSVSASSSCSYTFKLTDCARILSAYLTVLSDVDSMTVTCDQTGESMTVGVGSADIKDILLQSNSDSGQGSHTLTFSNPSATSSWVCSGRINIRYIEG